MMQKRKLFARPLLAAGAGIAAVVWNACGGGGPPVGNLKPLPPCDANANCAPDAGRTPQEPDGGVCYCPPDAG